MTTGMRTIIFPVTNLDGAKTLYGQLLGVAPSMDAPYYVQFNVGGHEIGLDPNGHKQGMTGPVAYWDVDDIQETVRQLVAGGAQLQQPVRDVGGGLLVAVVRDGDGNPIGLKQAP